MRACSQFLARAPADEERADATAAAALDVADEAGFIANSAAVSMPQHVPISASTVEDRMAEAPAIDEILAWLVSRLEATGPGQPSPESRLL
jgi:hypothetical protein